LFLYRFYNALDFDNLYNVLQIDINKLLQIDCGDRSDAYLLPHALARAAERQSVLAPKGRKVHAEVLDFDHRASFDWRMSRRGRFIAVAKDWVLPSLPSTFLMASQRLSRL
jgi:hypothetical protein